MRKWIAIIHTFQAHTAVTVRAPRELSCDDVMRRLVPMFHKEVNISLYEYGNTEITLDPVV